MQISRFFLLKSRKLKFCSNFLYQKPLIKFSSSATATKTFKPKSCYYKVLNVSTDASPDEIKRSYLDLAKKYHPDTKFGDKVQEEKFKEIHEAYKVLTDDISRKIYNQENGIESEWFHGKVDSDFGAQDGRYSQYSSEKMTHEYMKERVKVDEEFANYFEKKYFKNYDYFYKHPVEDDPFEMTPKLVRLKNEIKRKKRDHIIHNPFTSKAFYEEKPDNDEQSKSQISKFEVIKDLKFPIFISFLFLTVYTICEGIYEANLGKKVVEKSKKVEKGSGYTIKLLPLNIV